MTLDVPASGASFRKYEQPADRRGPPSELLDCNACRESDLDIVSSKGLFDRRQLGT
jgi:hypothetical protein